jgi:hypothetical protein
MSWILVQTSSSVWVLHFAILRQHTALSQRLLDRRSFDDLAGTPLNVKKNSTEKYFFQTFG